MAKETLNLEQTTQFLELHRKELRRRAKADLVSVAKTGKF